MALLTAKKKYPKYPFNITSIGCSWTISPILEPLLCQDGPSQFQISRREEVIGIRRENLSKGQRVDLWGVSEILSFLSAFCFLKIWITEMFYEFSFGIYAPFEIHAFIFVLYEQILHACFSFNLLCKLFWYNRSCISRCSSFLAPAPFWEKRKKKWRRNPIILSSTVLIIFFWIGSIFIENYRLEIN